MKSFKCVICGYIHNGDNPPELCSVCGASASEFELFAQPVVALKEQSAVWRCIVCEYIHKGSEAPDICPVCGVTKENFETYSLKESSRAKAETGHIIILGGGIAGLAAAEEIRKRSEDMNITIISAENPLPYYRINLTRYLAQEINKDKLMIHPDNWYTEKRIKFINGQEANAIKTATKQVELQDGTALTYDKLIVAMGASPFIPPITGSNLENVVTVRTLDDAEYILKRLPVMHDCICIGGGILGLETAGAIAKSGMKVTLLESAPWLMPRQLNAQGAKVLKKYLEGIGIEVRENTKIKEITGKDFCQGIMMEDGEIIPAELVVITAGVKPDTSLARKAGLAVDNGLVVNNYMQTSDDNIFAAGDVTQHHGMVYGLWNVAQYQGKIAALNAIGIETQFGGVPRSSVLKVLGLDLFSIGDSSLIDDSYYQYDQEESNHYFSFVLKDSKIVGSIIIGDKALAIKVKQAVENGTSFPQDVHKDAISIIHKLQE
ncbi:MAG: FAD-dependent oxidoreductase [Sporomusaceae bacterium]|nr:FAD-dependent oxidoreductase [Sporomusaceae bacterium]